MLTELLTGGVEFYHDVQTEQAPRLAQGSGMELLRAPGSFR
jgi:hypothetical protein